MGKLPVMFGDPKPPVQTCLILSINSHRFSGFLTYGDRYFIYRKIYPLPTALAEAGYWALIPTRRHQCKTYMCMDLVQNLRGRSVMHVLTGWAAPLSLDRKQDNGPVGIATRADGSNRPTYGSNGEV